MLEISYRNGSYSDPLVGPRLTSKECQTDGDSSPTSNLNSAVNSLHRTSVATEAKGTANLKTCCVHCNRRSSNGSGQVTNSSSCPSVNDRPVSVASSTDSEEDDEITFNTIKRQTNLTSKNNNGVKVNGDHSENGNATTTLNNSE